MDEALTEFLSVCYMHHADRKWMRFCTTVRNETSMTLLQVKRKYYEIILYGEWEDMKYELVRDWNAHNDKENN